MVRFVAAALVAALAGCASHAATGPAWPKPHASEDDGGESIAPHVSRADSTAAIENADDDAKPVAAAPATPAAAPASEPAATPAATPPAQPSEDTIIIDDIVIQIDD